MTKKELIELLEDYSDDIDIMLYDLHGYYKVTHISSHKDYTKDIDTPKRFLVLE